MTISNSTTSSKTASVIDQSILAFGVGLDPEARADIKNVYQFASRVASKRFSEEGQTEAWFNQFVDTMRDCGWVTLQRSYDRESSQSQSLKLGAVMFKGIKVVGQAVLSNPLTDALVKVAGDALEGLGSVTEAQDLFQRNLKEKQSSTIGLGACIKNEAGEIFLAISAVDSKPFDDHDLDTVLFEWKSTASELYSGNALFVFNRDLYDTVRETIRGKLTDTTISKVLDYDI